jgi:hypothetical protein
MVDALAASVGVPGALSGRRMEAAGVPIKAYSVHPGFINTSLRCSCGACCQLILRMVAPRCGKITFSLGCCGDAVRHDDNLCACLHPCCTSIETRSRHMSGRGPLVALWSAFSVVPGLPSLIGAKTVPQVTNTTVTCLGIPPCANGHVRNVARSQCSAVQSLRWLMSTCGPDRWLAPSFLIAGCCHHRVCLRGS